MTRSGVCLCALGVGLMGCADDGGVHTGVLHVSVTEVAGAGETNLVVDDCVRFPVLIGGRRQVIYELDSGLSASVVLSPTSVSVGFEPKIVEESQFDRSRLDLSPALVVPVSSGAQFTFALVEGCPQNSIE